MDTYVVTLTHPKLNGPLVAELIASNERAAVARLRHYAFHEYREPSMLTTECTAELASVTA